MESQFGQAAIEVVRGDITKETVDAIVNAANSSLLGGGGVDGAIHRAGGPSILAECRKLGGCPAGEARITTGGNLAARHVIHTVGPIYRGGQQNEAVLLADCHRNSLALAAAHGAETVAFPAISCGVYGYPIPEAAGIAMTTVKTWLETHGGVRRVRFVLFGDDTYVPFERALAALEA